MKLIFPLLIATALYSCGNTTQSKALEQANETQQAVQPGTIATSRGGYTMKATIDGKAWTASSMMPPDRAGRIVGYYNSQYIGLPYSKADMVPGKKIALGEDNAADLSLNNGCLYKDLKGVINITKADATGVEGTFAFTTVCGATNKAVDVRDGFFRILPVKN
jgi:hypothetical protein